MPWVGLAYCTVQQQVVVTAPGGRPIYRVLATCGCGAKHEYMVLSGPELANALGDVGEHWLIHLKDHFPLAPR